MKLTASFILGLFVLFLRMLLTRQRAASRGVVRLKGMS